MEFNHLQQAKISPPSLPNIFLTRDRCYAELDSCFKKGHVFIQAASGYGKSTLAHSYLIDAKHSFLWISLSPSENNSIPLIDYLCFAFEQIGIRLDKTISLLKATHLTNNTKLESQFKNDFVQLKEPLYIVLDDVHHIDDDRTLSYLLDLLKICPGQIKFIFLSRNKLTVREWSFINRISFLNQSFLKFTQAEFTQLTSGRESNIDSYNDGWITAIQISLESNNPSIHQPIEHIVKEAVNQFDQPEQIYFLAMLDYFDAQICAKLFNQKNFIEQILSSSLILVQYSRKTDDYRFHHLIQEILLNSIPENLQPKLDRIIESSVSYYLEKEKSKEAFELAINSGKEVLINKAFLVYRLKCFNSSRLQDLATAYGQTKTRISSISCVHSLTGAWIEILNGNTVGMIREVEKIESTNIPSQLKNEFWALKAYCQYVLNRPREALKAVRKARDFEITNKYADGYLYIFQIGSLQALGKTNEAFSSGIEALSIANDGLVKSLILLVLCYISRLEGRQQSQYDFARALMKISEDSKQVEGTVQASCFTGEYYYNKGELKTAERFLKYAYQNRAQTIGIIAMSINWLYAQTLFSIGKSQLALSIIQQAIEEETLSGNVFMLDFYTGMRAYFNLRNGNSAEAQLWSNSVELNPNLPVSESYTPVLTKVFIERICNSQNNSKIGHHLFKTLKESNNKRFLGEYHIISCLELIGQNKHELAKKELRRALVFLSNSDFKELYEDYAAASGPFRKLIQEVSNKQDKFGYSKEVMLTNREHQIIELYELRLTNKEIAEKLGISLATVKRHNVNIFNKLQVSSKRQAIAVVHKNF